MAKVNIKINGQDLAVESGMTILQAAQTAGIYIPTLCYHPDLALHGVCRICSVEVKGQRVLCASCAAIGPQRLFSADLRSGLG